MSWHVVVGSRASVTGFLDFPRLGIPFKGIKRIIEGYIGMYRVQGLGLQGFAQQGQSKYGEDIVHVERSESAG